ncbi:hypothetical protein K443DRAFT_14400 [Laccaria amethystina LaAM-08-1]|uniref:Uncharacterized protein n=1 Tax=Laccaria amethystina LaAM-08-1 TaxID=1095629 RepID=A0A0C9WHM1_9AGAR|nr:hypothetical protein K443DRAFT_14400 [Laccaria amethystina LaAM-08-1]
MMKKQNIKTYRAVVVDEEEVWSGDVMRVVYCSVTQEIDRLHKAKSDEAFDLKLTLVCKNCDAWEVALVATIYIM